MSAVLPRSPETRRRVRERSTPTPGEGGSVVRGGFPLSPIEQEILNLCLNAPEDPRDVGMLPASLSAECGRNAPANPAAS